MHLRHLDTILAQLVDQLRRVELTVAPAGLDDLALLVEGEVDPGEGGPDVGLEELQDLVVADGAGVGEVVDARLVVAGEQERGWEQVVQEGV